VRPTTIDLAFVALIVILVVWFSGTKFVSDAANGASLGIALATGVAILRYATILFITIPTQVGATVRPAADQRSAAGER
jgi:hypothetical protein